MAEKLTYTVSVVSALSFFKACRKDVRMYMQASLFVSNINRRHDGLL
jgi:hypothetical protein